MEQEYIIEITFRANFNTLTQEIKTKPMEHIEGDEIVLRDILKENKVTQKDLYLVAEKAFDFVVPDFPKDKPTWKIENVNKCCERMKDKTFHIIHRIDNRLILKDEYFLI